MVKTMATSRKGTDPDECLKAMTVLKKTNRTKLTPGNSVAVRRVQVCHDLPRKDLYSLEEE